MLFASVCNIDTPGQQTVIRSDNPVTLLLLWSHKCDFSVEPMSRIIATSAVKGLKWVDLLSKWKFHNYNKESNVNSIYKTSNICSKIFVARLHTHTSHTRMHTHTHRWFTSISLYDTKDGKRSTRRDKLDSPLPARGWSSKSRLVLPLDWNSLQSPSSVCTSCHPKGHKQSRNSQCMKLTMCIELFKKL
jgi:hypothetical protein